jgi:hypothetical protein
MTTLSTLFALAVVALGLAAAGVDSWRDARRGAE